MKRLHINHIAPGTVLEEPLYNNRRKLLLAKGNALTAEMLAALTKAGDEFAYLGEWDPMEVARFESARPVGAYRARAAAMSATFHQEMEGLLKNTQHEVHPDGTPLEDGVDTERRGPRDAAAIEKTQEALNDGKEVVEEFIAGNVEGDLAGERATEAVDTLIDTMCDDMGLLINLTNLKGRDNYLYEHSVNTSVLAISIATSLGFDRNQVRQIGITALFQDVGMAMVPQEVLNLPRRLTPVEMLDVQKHPTYALHALTKIGGLPRLTRYVAYQCHERANGSGYPCRRDRKLIHSFAQIISVADVFDALCSDRPWRKAYEPYRAMEIVIRMAHQGKFEGGIVRGLLRYISLFPIGTLVLLTSGEVGRVIHTNPQWLDRPVVRILFDADGNRLGVPVNIDLAGEACLRIGSVVDHRSDVDPMEGFAVLT